MEAMQRVLPVALVLIWTLGFLAESQQVRIPVGALLSEIDSAAGNALTQGLSQATNDQNVQLDLQTENVDLKDSFLVSQTVSRLLSTKGIATLVVPSVTPVIAWWANRYKVPVVSLRPRSLPTNTPDPSVDISPDPMLALIDVMRFYKWTSLHYFYQDDDGLERLQVLQKVGSGTLNLATWFLHRVEDAHTARSILRQLDVTQTSSRVFVALDMDPDLVSQILTDVTSATYLEKKNFHFLLFQPADETFWQMPFLKGLQVTGIRLYDPKAVPQGLSLDSHRNLYGSMTQWLLASDASRLMVEAFGRFVRAEPNSVPDLMLGANKTSDDQSLPHGNELTRYLRETYVSEKSAIGPLQFNSDGKRRAYVFDIIEVTDDGPVKAFSWSDATGRSLIAPSYVQRGPTLGSRTLIVTTLLVEPYLMLKPNAQDLQGNDRYVGYALDLLDVLTKEMNVTYEIKLCKDGKYGTLLPGGQWNGMVGELVKHEADLALGDLTITSHRHGVLDYSTPFMSIGISLMVKKPSWTEGTIPPPSSAYFFLSPFAPEVWGCLVVALVVVGVAHFGICRLLSKAGVSSIQSMPRSSSFLDSLWFAFGSLFLRQTGLQPKSFSNRVLSGVWWVFAFFVLALYVTSLVSILVNNEMGISGQSRQEQLLQKSSLEIIAESINTGFPKIGLIKGGSTEAFFKNSKDAFYLQFYQSIKNKPELFKRGTLEGFNSVVESDGDVAFLMESNTNEYMSMKHCKTLVIPQLLDSKGYGIATAKGSPLSPLLNAALLKVKEQGFVQQLYTKWWIDPHICSKTPPGKKMKDLYHSSMSMTEVAGVFYLLVAGALLTLLVALAEILHSRRSGHGPHRVALTNVSNKSDSDQLNGEGLHGEGDRSSI